MKKALKLTLFLGLVAAICTGILAGVNMLTKDRIAEQSAGAETAALKEMYPDATKITVIDDFEADSAGLVVAAYRIDESAYAFRVSSQGYSAPIIFLIGFDSDGSNSKYKVLEVNDTAGIGDRIIADDYVTELTGLATTDSFPLISGATKSSTAVVDGIGAAVEVFNSLTGSTGGPSTPEPEEDEQTLVNEVEADGTITYTVLSKGFYADSQNEFTITIDTTTNTIVEVVNTVFSDTVGFGDAATTTEHLAKYAGLSAIEESNVDVVSGATFTSKSLDNAVKFALGLYGEREIAIPPVEVDGVITYTVSATGFYPDFKNTFEVSIDTATDTIVSVVNTSFNDTVGIGDAAISEEHLAAFAGLSVTEDLSVDVVAGATVTSKSVSSAVADAIAQYNERGE